MWRRSAYMARTRAANTTAASGRQQQQPDETQQQITNIMHDSQPAITSGLLGSSGHEEEAHGSGGGGGSASTSSRDSGGSRSLPSGAGAREALLLAAEANAARADPLHRAVSYPALERLKGLYHHHAVDHKVRQPLNCSHERRGLGSAGAQSTVCARQPYRGCRSLHAASREAWRWPHGLAAIR